MERETRFTARLKIERDNDRKISAFDLEGEFPTFNRIWRATRKMLTADQEWDNATIFISKKVKK